MEEHYSYWQQVNHHTSQPVKPNMSVPSSADVVIVGAGIAGLSTALHILQHGRKPLVLDRATIGSGATVRSTGMLTREPGTDYAVIAEKHGMEYAQRIAGIMNYAAEIIHADIEQYKFDCDYIQTSSLYIAPSQRDIAHLEKEFSIKRQIGYSCDWFNEADLHTTNTPVQSAVAALRTHGVGAIDPYKWVKEIAAYIRAHGGQIIEGVAVEQIEQKKDERLVHTSAGVVQATAVCIAADNDLDKWQPQIEPYFSLHEAVMVSKPIESLPNEYTELFWNTYELFEYARVLPGKRLLIGSGRTASLHGLSARQMRKCAELLCTAASNLLGVDGVEAESVWQGAFGMTDDELPYIGYMNGIYSAGGYNGHGLVLGYLAGRLLSDAIVGLTPEVDGIKIFEYPHMGGKRQKKLYQLLPGRWLQQEALHLPFATYKFKDYVSRRK